jgi:hypothetical protein
MKRTIYLHVCILLLVAGTVSVHAQASTPERLVKDLYTAHDAGNGPFGANPDRSRVDTFFTPRLGGMLWKELNSKSDEVGAIDGDPLYNAQDMEIKNFKIGKAAINGSNATVPVSFTNFKKKERLTYVLKKVGKDWRVDDIKYSPSDSLSKWLKNPGK